jgi:hypothetical protein
LFIKRCRAGAAAGLVDLMTAALDASGRLKLPALILYGEKDALVPRACIARMIAELPPQTRHLQRVALYREGYHMLLRDRRAGVVLADIADTRDSLSALPRMPGRTFASTSPEARPFRPRHSGEPAPRTERRCGAAQCPLVRPFSRSSRRSTEASSDSSPILSGPGCFGFAPACLVPA